MKSKIEINISVIDDGPVVMRCQGQNTSKGKALERPGRCLPEHRGATDEKGPLQGQSRRKPPRNLAR